MKIFNKFKVIIIGGVVLILVGIVAYNLGASKNESTINENRAKEIALAHANVNESNVSYIQVNYSYDNNRAEYDVDFVSENVEYDYEIDAVTGNIISYDYDTERNQNTTSVVNTQNIDENKAKEIALAHANVNESNVSYIQVNYSYDNNRAEYDVDFVSENVEYDYEIDAVTGNIISYDYDTKGNQNTTSEVNTQNIDENKAKEIALAHANVNESDVSYIQVNYSYDNNIAEYDVDFVSENVEYDYEIDAVTGNIISYDYDLEHLNTNVSTNNEYISSDEAKKIALNDAGLNESDINYIQVEFDLDDGIASYDIEWELNFKEYDYNVNAVNGAIIKRSIENDD